MGCKHLVEYSHTKIKHDEYYTTKEEVEYVIKDFIGHNYFKNKIVYCPCDSEKSEFVKYFKEHEDELKYKEFIYTSDDFNTHADLFEYADIVITNPPFSKIRGEFLPMIQKYAKKYFYFHSITALEFYISCDNNSRIYRSPYTKFITPIKHDTTDDYYQLVQHIYVTNIEVCKSDGTTISRLEKTYDELYKEKTPIYGTINAKKDYGNDFIQYGKKYLTIDRIKNIPIDYKEPMCVPVTIGLYNIKKYFNILYNIKVRPIEYSDGRSRYVRILVEWKDK